MTTPRRTRTELAMNERVARAHRRTHLVAVASAEPETLSIPRPLDAAEVAELQHRRHRTRAALRSAWWLVAVAVAAFYLVPTGAALGWWGS